MTRERDPHYVVCEESSAAFSSSLRGNDGRRLSELSYDGYTVLSCRPASRSKVYFDPDPRAPRVGNKCKDRDFRRTYCGGEGGDTAVA